MTDPDTRTTDDERNSLSDTITFFAYGTLRKGERLHEWIESEIVEDHGKAYLKYARLHFSTSHRAYPYLVVTDSPSDVTTGELFTLRLSQQTLDMLSMEQGAGYKIVEMTAELDGAEVPTVVCEWPNPYGEQVPENDWLSRADVLA